MIPVSIVDVLGGLATAQHLYKIGFRRANSASGFPPAIPRCKRAKGWLTQQQAQKYREFGEDIRNLAVNLDLLSDVIQRAQYQAGTFDRVSRYISPVPEVDELAAQNVLGNFRETLNDCGRLLNNQRYFQKCDGFVSSIHQYTEIDPEVQKLRDRIALHNIKLSISLKILDSQILEDRSIQIIDSTTAILTAVEKLGQQVRGEEEGEEFPSELPGLKAIPQEVKDGFVKCKRWVEIPQELQDCFVALNRRLYPDFQNFSLCQGIDAALTYFNMVTKTPDKLVQSEARYLSAIINILKAAWMLRTVQASQEFKNAARYYSTNAFEQLMDQWGLTIERFFDEFEEEIHEAFRLLLGRHLILPPTPDLLQILASERQIWPGDLKYSIKKEAEPPELGTKIMNAQLKTSDPGYTQTMQVYRQTEKRFNLLLLNAYISEGREKETIDGFDLENVQIIPSYAKRTWATPSLEPQTILFKVDSISPVSRILAFQQGKDLFEFQQTITGYKVVHDDNRVLVTSQESKLLRGTRRQDLCRIQLWSAPTPKADVVVARQTPYLEPTAIESRRSLQTFLPNSGSPGRKPSAPNLSMSSSRVRSSSSSRSSIVTDPPALPKLDAIVGASTTQGTIYTAPVAPRIVLFAHKAVTPSQAIKEDETSRSFLIIDITAEVTIQEELSEGELTYNRSYQCVVEKKGSYLPARRSPETTDASLWDLSVAGLHKNGAGTDVVKRLKHVIIQFDTQNSLSQFMMKFNQVKDLAKLRLSQFVSLTRTPPAANAVELP